MLFKLNFLKKKPSDNSLTKTKNTRPINFFLSFHLYLKIIKLRHETHTLYVNIF